MPNILEMIDKFLNLKFAGELTVEVVCFRLLLAIILGGIVGYEREKNNRPAGFRTHILVCFGAAIVSMVQDQLRLNILDLARTEGTAVASVIKTDLGRLGAQVISGVGFLGAGSIANGLIEAYEIFRQKSIKISEIDKYQDEGIVTFTVSIKGRNNISDVVVSLSSIKNVEYVKDV